MNCCWLIIWLIIIISYHYFSKAEPFRFKRFKLYRRPHHRGCASEFQVWFQNRRMKDKRQRLAMTWPHPADPAFYSYMVSHAGNLPYSFSSHLPLTYYSPLSGMAGGSATAAGPPAFANPLRSLDTFRLLSHPYPRPELLCAFRYPSLYASAGHVLGPGGSACSCLACQSNGTAQRSPTSADVTCSSTSRDDTFLMFSSAFLNKSSSSVSVDQREQAPLTR